MKQIRQALYTAFSVALAAAPAVAGAQWNAGNAGTGSNLASNSITTVLGTLMKGLLGIVGVIGVIAFVIAGILYLTAAGNEEQIEKAKTTMLYSIVGMIVALLGWVIVTAISTWLVGNSATF